MLLQLQPVSRLTIYAPVSVSQYEIYHILEQKTGSYRAKDTDIGYQPGNHLQQIIPWFSPNDTVV